MLYHWFYISTSCLDLVDSEAHASDIVRVSTARNRSLGVTGALLFTGQRFSQYIEGPRASIEELRRSISADWRHTDIKTVALGPHQHRHFLEWSLAYEGPSHFVSALVEQALADALSNRNGNAGKLLHMMEEFTVKGRS